MRFITLQMLIIKLFSMMSTFIISALIGRHFGAEILGLISSANKWLGLVSLFALYGTRQILIRNFAAKSNKTEQNEEVLSSSFSLVITLIVIIVFVVFILTKGLNIIPINFIYIITLISFPFIALSRLFSGIILGRREFIRASTIDDLLAPISVVLYFVITMMFSVQVVLEHVMFFYLLGRILSFCLAANFIGQILKKVKLKIVKSHIRGSHYMVFSSIVSTFFKSSPVLLGSFLLDPLSLGLVTASFKASSFFNIPLNVLHNRYSPVIAELYVDSRFSDMRNLIHRMNSRLFVVSTILIVLVVYFRTEIIGIWGSDFAYASKYFVIFAIAAAVNLSTGLLGSVFTMTNNEELIFKLNLIAVIAIFIVVPTVYNYFGELGFVLAVSIISSATALSKLVVVNLKLNEWIRFSKI